MSKNIFDEALQELRYATVDLEDLEIIHSYDVSKIENALKLGGLYKELYYSIKKYTAKNPFEEMSILTKIREIENEKEI